MWESPGAPYLPGLADVGGQLTASPPRLLILPGAFTRKLYNTRSPGPASRQISSAFFAPPADLSPLKHNGLAVPLPTSTSDEKRYAGSPSARGRRSRRGHATCLPSPSKPAECRAPPRSHSARRRSVAHNVIPNRVGVRTVSVARSSASQPRSFAAVAAAAHSYHGSRNPRSHLRRNRLVPAELSRRALRSPIHRIVGRDSAGASSPTARTPSSPANSCPGSPRPSSRPAPPSHSGWLQPDQEQPDRKPRGRSPGQHRPRPAAINHAAPLSR